MCKFSYIESGSQMFETTEWEKTGKLCKAISRHKPFINRD